MNKKRVAPPERVVFDLAKLPNHPSPTPREMLRRAIRVLEKQKGPYGYACWFAAHCLRYQIAAWDVADAKKNPRALRIDTALQFVEYYGSTPKQAAAELTDTNEQMQSLLRAMRARRAARKKRR
jgi:hypothetical protein